MGVEWYVQCNRLTRDPYRKQLGNSHQTTDNISVRSAKQIHGRTYLTKMPVLIAYIIRVLIIRSVLYQGDHQAQPTTRQLVVCSLCQRYPEPLPQRQAEHDGERDVFDHRERVCCVHDPL